MSNREYSNKELKLTAAVYTKLKGVLEHVRSTGRLPEEIYNGGAHICSRLIIEKRGTNITLTPDEKMVLDAIVRERRLPGGSVILFKETE